MDYLKISEIKPAGYNPRRITEDAFKELQGSLKTLGFILPIIVNRDNMTIVAGHQRTKACVEVGIESVPAFFISGVDIESEVMFNQLHNGIELEPEKLGHFNSTQYLEGFVDKIDSTNFSIPESNPEYVKEYCALITRFGDALCAIICGDEVVFGNNYIRAAQLLGIPVHCSFISESKRELFDFYFKKKYGAFNYDHIEKADFVQGRAQMTNKKFENSGIYRLAYPFISALNNKELNILDFGCGKGFSVKHMREVLGYKNMVGLEFFNHNRVGISVEKGHEMIDRLIAHVKKHGLFDVVVCDSVLNSVNSQEAEDAVLTTLIKFCKPGGMIFFCGRVRADEDRLKSIKRSATLNHAVQFHDEHGLTAKMTQGQFFFQKYHRKEEVEAIIKKYDLDAFLFNFGFAGAMWNVGAYKRTELPEENYIAALDFEFNMKLPNGVRYGRNNDIRELFGYPQI